jgi:tetratricopeptide (TPR) repeat protein/predicted Ser/Thr protein kinase
MDAGRWQKIAQLYDLACEQPIAVRDSFLAGACQGDEELRLEIESLLRQGVSQDGPLERIAEHALTAWSSPASIGGYRILRLIGEGGMGAVYEAEQDQPRRTVALKVLKSAWAAPDLLRRFARESEVLGRLQHPNIAQVYEAGSAQTDLGPQPYFAMEFIRGVSLLAHADQNGLNIAQKLELMIKICEAVDYAHRQGVIHRDLKPSNILVDQTGEPKILDFGVARVVGNELNATRQTSLGDLVGTLEYMSPEQLLADPTLLDARSDVYSLGVVFYELLAGRRPYQTSRQWTDAARVIREEEPFPLSAVSRLFGGDLETIVAKCLEKDKERRYSSAAEKGSDLRRFLAHEPILARPATAIYRAQKFVRRHRVLVTAAGAVFIVLVAGIVASTSEAIRASRERDRALRAEEIAKAVTDFLQNDLLAQASARAQAGTRAIPDPNLKVRTALDRAAAHVTDKFGSQPIVEASIRHTLGLTYYDLNLYPEAQQQLERAVELRKRTLGVDQADTLTSMNALGVLYNYQSRYAQAEALLSQVLAARRRVLGDDHKDTLATMSDLALAIAYEGDPARAAPIFAKVLESDRRILGEENPATLSALDNLAGAYRDSARWAEAKPLLEREVELNRRVLGPEHPDTTNSVLGLAAVYRALGEYKIADALFLAALDSLRRSQGEGHWETENARRNLALSYRAQERYSEADPLFKQALASLQRGLGPEHPLTLQVAFGLGESYRKQRRFAESERILTEVLEARRRVLGDKNPYTAQALAVLGETKLDQLDYAGAERLLREALQIREQRTPHAWERYYTQSMLGASLLALGKYSEARPLLTSGYQGMIQQQSSIPAEYRPALEQARTWSAQP